jgi:hypothetical protein
MRYIHVLKLFKNQTNEYFLYSMLLRKSLRSGQFKGSKILGPLKMSLEMAHKVIVPQKKNYVPQFLKQRDINSYYESRQSARTGTETDLFDMKICKFL